MRNSFSLFFYNLKRFFTGRSALSVIILINISIFLFLWICQGIEFLFMGNGTGGFYDLLVSSLAFPANWNVYLKQPWAILSYMFIDTGFWHFLFNMVVLYWVGLLLQQYKGERTTLLVYIVGGVLGAAAFMGAYSLPYFESFRYSATLLDSTPAMLAVLAAAVYTLPDMEYKLFLLGKVKLKYLALAIFIFDLLAIRSGQEGLYFAHVGGAIGGFLWIFLSNQLVSGKPKVHKPKMKAKKTSKPQRPMTDREFNEERAANQKRIDEILDKISKYGYDKLTKEEKEFLFKQK